MSSTILLKNGTVLVHSDNDINPTVEARPNTDVLIEGDKISAIKSNLDSPDGTTVIDCTGKIVSPGFISTHSHLWQSQLKGRFSDDTLFDYMPRGNFMSHVYEAVDTYWGQLAGCLEAINAGTTTVLDHAHGCKTADHVEAAIQATIDSGLRCVWAYSEPARFSGWTSSTCSPSYDIWTAETVNMITGLVKKHNAETSSDRFSMGIGFDLWFLPPQAIEGIFSQVIAAGVQTITSHTGRDAVQGFGQPIKFIKDQAPFLFDTPADGQPTGLENFVLSHAHNIPKAELESLLPPSVGTHLNASISTTPESESQMGMHHSVAFSHPSVFPEHRVSLGIDCHAAASSFMPHAGRVGLFNARIRQNERLASDDNKFPLHLTGNSGSALLNSYTVNGARALGLDHDNGGTGRLAVGRKADIVIFDAGASLNMGVVAEKDPVQAVTRFAELGDIETVIVDGIIRKKHKKLLPVDVHRLTTDDSEQTRKMDWNDIRRELMQSYGRLQQRMDKLNVEKAGEMMVALYHIDKSKYVDDR